MGTRYVCSLVLRNLVVNKEEILWKIKCGGWALRLKKGRLKDGRFELF